MTTIHVMPAGKTMFKIVEVSDQAQQSVLYRCKDEFGAHDFARSVARSKGCEWKETNPAIRQALEKDRRWAVRYDGHWEYVAAETEADACQLVTKLKDAKNIDFVREVHSAGEYYRVIADNGQKTDTARL